MPLAKKEIPPAVAGNLIPPDVNRSYFENCAHLPFDADASMFSLRNAWWLAEASFFAYQSPEAPLKALDLGLAGFQFEFITTARAQAVLIYDASAIIVAFRGTRIEGFGDQAGFFGVETLNLGDLITDLNALPTSIASGCLVYGGFAEALDDCWPKVSARIESLQALTPRKVWFAGNSLGAGLAAVAAYRAKSFQGLYTFGAPKIGNDRFASRFLSTNTFRIVNGCDIVSLLLPGDAYQHVGTPKFILNNGTIADSSEENTWQNVARQSISFATIPTGELLRFNPLNMKQWPVTAKPLADHAPICYANHLWNLNVA